MAVTVPVQGHKGSFVLIQDQPPDLRQSRVPLRRRSLRAYLIFQRALLDKLDRGILHRIVRNGSAKHQTLQCLGRNVHDRTVFTACRNVHVRHLAGQQFAINQDEVLQRQFIGKLRRTGKAYFHFQPALALVGLELLRAAISELRRRNKVGADFQQLKIYRAPRLRHCRRYTGRDNDRTN